MFIDGAGDFPPGSPAAETIYQKVLSFNKREILDQYQ